jgi:uncharacterized protein (TIGR00251 family)
MAILVRDTPAGARFLVRVAPRASRNAMMDVMGEGDAAAVKIALQAPPAEGRANAALIAFLASSLKVPRSSIEIAGGERSRNKTIVVHGRTATEVAALIENALPPK